MNDTSERISEPHRVAIVVDAMFGTRIHALAESIHVWLVDTPENRRTTEAVWKRLPVHSLDHGVTLFRVDLALAPDQWAAEILDTIILHHGEYSHTPPVSVIDIYGCPATDLLRAALAEFSFTDLATLPGSLRASARPTE